MLHLAYFALLSVTGLAVPDGSEGERAATVREQRAVAQTPGRVTSIVDLATPAELRDHGIGTYASTASSGYSVTLLQAPGVPSGGYSNFSFVPKDRALYLINISAAVTQTGFPERLLLGTPWPPPTTPRPVLFFHHRFGRTHLDLTFSTSFLAEASSRDWYVFAPLGATNKSFGSSPSQINMEVGFDLVSNLPGIFFDPDRVYGVGFSMGGGSLLSYAARHTDATTPTIAAMVNHSGGTCLSHTYESDVPARSILEFWFGTGVPGDPDPWELARHSSIYFDPNDGPSGAFQTDDDMVRNVKDSPLWMLRASDDLIPYLSVQSDALDNHLRNVLGVVPGSSYVYNIVPFNGHEWSMLDEAEALDFLGQFTRQLPTANTTLIDRDGRWFFFYTTQDVGGQFSELDWDVDTGSNSLTMNTQNLNIVTVETALAGLDVQSQIVINNNPVDGIVDDILIRDLPMAPTTVLLDGQPVTTSFIGGTLRLLAPDDLPHVWTIVP